VTSAQARRYDVIMKDVASAFGALWKSADASDFAGSIEHGQRLERLFKETEDLWTKFKTKAAIDAAAGAKVAASMLDDVTAGHRGNENTCGLPAASKFRFRCAVTTKAVSV
jgi:hypothetical protein